MTFERLIALKTQERNMAPKDALVKGLGAYMRDIGRNLQDSKPMSPKDAAKHAHGVVADEPYCTMVLLRLEIRGIAKRFDVYIDNGFVRGENWHEAARMYKWDPSPVPKGLPDDPDVPRDFPTDDTPKEEE